MIGMRDKKHEDTGEYGQLLHKMQTGVKFELELDVGNLINDAEKRQLKHLRVGINNALLECGFIEKVLIAKGLLTQEELEEGLLQMLREEVARYEKSLSERMGKVMKLL